MEFGKFVFDEISKYFNQYCTVGLFARMIKMSTPIHNHYRFASPRHTKASMESEELGMLNNRVEQENTSLLIDDLQPQPLAAAMYSFQFMADVVNRVQTALKCTSQNPQNSLPQIKFKSSDEPSFCYFFIDMQPQSENDYDYAQYSLESSENHKSDSDKHLDRSALSIESTTPNLQRQRSISECSDDSFICFEDNTESTAFGYIDLNDTEKSPDIDIDSREERKKVRFNLNPQIHLMCAWDFAYRAARKGDWQTIARDRERFQQRIKRVTPILNTILNSKHRENVYKDRFLNIK